MRLVMTYNAGDRYTYSCDVATPIVYESGEAAIVEFERMCLTAFAERQQSFMFAGNEMDVGTFMFADEGKSWKEAKYYGPDFLTVDEWFNQAGAF
jgi:hypothetical protein